MNGFMNINKPPDWTSHDVVAKVRGLLGQAKVGHTGTLDPMATGVLPLCVGHATKVAQYLADADVTFDVECSKGTYVRTLCVEAGERLGVGAYLQGLDRRRVGRFAITDAVTVADVEAAVRAGEAGRHLLAVDEVLSHLPAVDVSASVAERVCHGVALPADRVEAWLGACRRGDLVRVRTGGVTVALATAPADLEDLAGGG